MLTSFVLSLREGLEAALIIGISLGVLKKMGKNNLVPALWQGALSAAGVCILAAVLMEFVGAELEGSSEAGYDAATMLLAALFLTWMIFWMQRQSRTLKPELEHNIHAAIGENGHRSIFLLAFVSIGREGFELALALVATRLTSDAWQTLAGSLAGLLGAVLLGWLVFSGTRRLNLKNFFAISNTILILFAAGLVANGFNALIEIGLVPALVNPVWNTSAWLSTDGPLGGILKALFGYNSQPSLSELLAYLGYFLIIFLVSWWGANRQKAQQLVSR